MDVSIITDCLNNPILQYKFIKSKGLTVKQEDLAIKELSRMFGYCILFKSNEGIEEYMQLQDKNLQIQFLQQRIAQIIGIPLDDIPSNSRKIVDYVYDNFIKNGYVFHAANSRSIEQKMKNRIKWRS